MYLMSETFCGLRPGIASCADIPYNDDVGTHLTLLIVLLLFIDHKVSFLIKYSQRKNL